MGWLDEHQPDDVAHLRDPQRLPASTTWCSHADDPLRVVGVLDWEMATLGDPLMDLGGALAYWIQADDDEFFRMFRRQPTHLPGMLTRARGRRATTASRMGLSVTPEQWRFYEVFGLFRLA